MGLFSFIGGLLGAGSQKKASHDAQAAMADAINRGITVQQGNLAQTRADEAPEMALGTASTGAYGDLTGANGNDKWGAAIDALKASPFYQSLFNNGQEAVLANASATGGIRGGNTQTGLARFGADTLAQTIQMQLSNLMGGINAGQTAKGVSAGVGVNTANNVSNLDTQLGTSNANQILTRGGITAGMWNSAGSFLDNAVSAAFPSAGAGGLGGFNFGSLLSGVF